MSQDNSSTQVMTYGERESLKHFATKCGADGDIQSLERTLIMIAHWMRQGWRITFSEYAGQWTEAQRARTDGYHSTDAMAEQWPFSGKRCISAGGSDYYPAGVDSAPEDDETEIRHAVTVLLAEYPAFNVNGLALPDSSTQWSDPLDNPVFLRAALSCLNWIRAHHLSHSQINTFREDNPTSYGLKHKAERFNQKNYPHTEQPHYIPNGAMIAAMVAAGYRVKPSGKMNALFNISRKALNAAPDEN